MRFPCIAILVAAALPACVSSRGLSSEEKEKLKANILQTVPQDVGTALDISFENKFRIIGAKADPAEAKPGTEVKLTYYWRCDDTIEDGWLLFTHVRDPVLDKRDNLDNVGPLRENRDPAAAVPKQTLPPSKWEKGKIYVDEQTYKVPDWAKAPELEVLVGIWKGNARLRIITGSNDGDNAAIAVKIKTGIQPPQEPKRGEVPVVSAYKLAKEDKITIDGKADEKAWGVTTILGPFVDVGTGEPPAPTGSAQPGGSVPPGAAPSFAATARLAWDDASLYVFFEVKDTDVKGGFDEKKKAEDKDYWTVKGQPMLWKRGTVEMMIDPDGDGDNDDYYELQINPQNKVFHSQFDHYREPMSEPLGPFGHEEWDPKLRSAVKVKGTLDKPEDADEGWSVEAAIPWASFGKAKQHPPKPGDTWRMNFYALKPTGALAWSPILGEGTFHKASRFGKATFVIAQAAPPLGIDPAGGPVPGPSGAPHLNIPRGPHLGPAGTAPLP